MVSSLKRDPLFFAFVLLQIFFWFEVKSIKPDMAILPEPQSETAIKASSFGDEQFYFRTLAFQIQNAGDTFGRTTPLKDYDYSKLAVWFEILDSLDSKSNFVPSLAAYYYSNTQYTPDVRYIVEYLTSHADKDPYSKWWWYAQAVYQANHKLQDKQLALKVAYKLAASENPDMPLWARQMPAFIHEDLGEKEQAALIINDILDNYEDIPEGELNFMYHFLKERIEAIKSGELQ